MDLGDALAWLDGHQNLEAMLADRRLAVPDLSRMRRLMDFMGDPQHQVPLVHLTGTNGKTSTARALTALLTAKGLNVGTYTSPHLERINERLAVAGEPVGDEQLAELLSSIAALEPLLGDGVRLTWFEILTAAAYRWFAEKPVDVSVVEVGLGGRWDATNVADGDVAVVTNIGLDHMEFLGPTRLDIALEKAGIVKPESILVLGETRPDLVRVFEDRGAAEVWRRGVEFSCTRNDLAVGGRLLDLRTPGASYSDVLLGLHGRHQADNFVLALAAAEAFFGAPIAAELVAEAAATVRSPGRLEIVGRRPLVILDGAKNVDGAESAARAIDEEFTGSAPGVGPGEPATGSRILVVGMLRGKDPEAMLRALGADRARVVVACPPPSPRAQPAAVVADAARALGCLAEEADSVAEAVDRALELAGPDDLVLVTGSLYVVGAARTAVARAHPAPLGSRTAEPD